MNPEILTGFVYGVATAATAGGITAAVTLRNIVRRSGAWKDLVARDERGTDALTGLYDLKGFVSAVEDLAVTAAETTPNDNQLCVIAYTGLEQIQGTYTPRAAEYMLAAIGTELEGLAVDGLACRFDYSLFAAVLGPEAADELPERMRLTACADSVPGEAAMWNGSPYVFPVFGFDPERAQDIYGPGVACRLAVASMPFDPGARDLEGLLETLGIDAVNELLEAARCVR